MAASTNNRLFYAVHQAGIKTESETDFTVIHGLQSASVTTTFNLEQAFELGQLSLYENIENIPDVEVNLTKVLDGYPLIYHLATKDATTPTLTGRANAKSLFALALFDDTADGAAGTPRSEMQASGMFTSSLGYNFPVDDNFTEDVTLVGNNKVWVDDANIVGADPWTGIGHTFTGAFASLDGPIGSGGVNRRENMIFDFDAGVGLDTNSMVADSDATILPPEVFGISSSGSNEKSNGIDFDAHLSSITVSADLGRDSSNELGRKGPYHRYVNFPVEVTCEIQATAGSGDMVSATEKGIYTPDTTDPCIDEGNLKDRTIRISTCEGTRIYLGAKNKLNSVNYAGGDVGGGNVTVSYTFTTFSDLTVMHSGDPNTNFAFSDRNTYLRDL
jgi:hypothetical protein